MGGLAPYLPRVVALLSRIPRLALAQRLALIACAVAAQETDLETLVPWRELFLELDADQDGRLSVAELSQGLRRIHGGAATRLPEEHMESVAAALDLDQSGYIDWIEWLAVG